MQRKSIYRIYTSQNDLKMAKKFKKKVKLKKIKNKKVVKKRVKKKVKVKLRIDNKQIEDLVLNISGEEGLALYKILRIKKNISEFILVDKLKLTINKIRNILYKFDSYGLVSSTRKKDRKKGWYIYYWTFDDRKAEEAILTIKRENMNKLKVQLERESNYNFFICPKKCIRLTYETAMENNFQCLECGNILNPEDNTKLINKLKSEIKSLEKEISEQEAK